MLILCDTKMVAYIFTHLLYAKKRERERQSIEKDARPLFV